MTVLDGIRARMNELTSTEAAFAEYVLTHDDLIFKSITVVAEESGVGYGTVIRFCRKLGFSGFQDFKIRMAVEAGAAAPETQDAEPGWLERRGEQAKSLISTAVHALDEERLRAAADLIARARLVVAVGVAGSFPVVKEFAYRLDRLGILAAAEQDTHLQMIKSSLLSPADVVFAVSDSGSTKEILDCATLARARGARVVALTNHPKSPLAEAADIVLNAAVREGALEAEIGTKLPFYFIVELLASLVMRASPDAAEHLRTSSDSVSSRLI